MKSLRTIAVGAIALAAGVVSWTHAASADADISVFINGERQSYSQMPILEGGSTLVPMRGVFQALGADVAWDGTTQTITATTEDTTVQLTLNRKTALVNGKEIAVSIPAKIVGGSTLVPLRFVSEALGANVRWEEATSTVRIDMAAAGGASGSSGSGGSTGSAPKPALTEAQAEALLAELEALVGGSFFPEASEEAPEGIAVDEETHLATYDIRGASLTNRQVEKVDAELAQLRDDEETQLELWNLFRSIIPAEARGDVAQFGFFTDGVDGTLAYVVQLEEDPTRWSVNVDLQDAYDLPMLAATLVHEYAHVASLNERQLSLDFIDQYVNGCSTLELSEGCAKEDSYLYGFYEAYWTDLYEEWESAVGWEADEDAAYEFYESYEDLFVNDYAATSVLEDFAESFSYFVLSPKPEGGATIEDKQLFFYDYPELVKLRTDILLGLKAYLQS
ncbi:MAG TPA: stalk domain-containing protein [Paenibacillus sp.]|nr:stalk domain-containing protein [Paenibacillus sp.]